MGAVAGEGMTTKAQRIADTRNLVMKAYKAGRIDEDQMREYMVTIAADEIFSTYTELYSEEVKP